MKLSTLKAKLTGMKLLAAVGLAGAVLAVATPAAEAQRVYIGVHGPRYFEPAPPVRFYGGPVYFRGYEHRRFEDWRFRHYGYRGYYR